MFTNNPGSDNNNNNNNQNTPFINYPQQVATPAIKFNLVNPTNLESEDKLNLDILLMDFYPNQTFFDDATRYEAGSETEPFHIQLTHYLHRLPNNKSFEVYRTLLNPTGGKTLVLVGHITSINDKMSFTASNNPIQYIYVDPTQLTSNSNLNGYFGGILTRSLEENAQKFFPAGFNEVHFQDPVTQQMSTARFFLKHGVVWQQTAQHNFACYEILGKKLGEGSFGQVFLSSGKLIPLENNFLDFEESNLIIKQQSHFPNKNPITSLYREYENGKKLGYLGLLPPTIIVDANGTMKSFLCGNRFLGVELFDWMLQNAGEGVMLDFDKLYSVCLGLAYRLKEQVHAHGIVSRDIKPENIIIDTKNLSEEYLMDIHNIDFGLSKKMHESDIGRPVGTPDFMAPECLAGLGTTEKSDIYALGVIFSQMWYTPLIANRNLVVPLQDLLLLQSLIVRMLKQVPAERPGIDEVILALDVCMMTRKFNLAPPVSPHDEFYKANAIAKSIYVALFPLKQRAIMSQENDFYVYMRGLLEDQINQLLDTPEIIQFFVSKFRMKVLQNCMTKKDLLTQLDTIITGGSLVANSILMMEEEFRKLKLTINQLKTRDEVWEKLCTKHRKLYSQFCIIKNAACSAQMDNFDDMKKITDNYTEALVSCVEKLESLYKIVSLESQKEPVKLSSSGVNLYPNRKRKDSDDERDDLAKRVSYGMNFGASKSDG